MASLKWIDNGAKPVDGFASHQQRDDGEHDRAGKSAEHADFRGAKTVERVGGLTPAEIIREGGDEKRSDMRAHVPAIGQQRHGIGCNADSNLEHHHRCGNGDDDARATFGSGRIQSEIVRVSEARMIGPMHHTKDTAI